MCIFFLMVEDVSICLQMNIFMYMSNDICLNIQNTTCLNIYYVLDLKLIIKYSIHNLTFLLIIMLVAHAIHWFMTKFVILE